jgi:NAD(P)-dependent dehydrogenase (short-subunit alcohol dehydrogenase family)
MTVVLGVRDQTLGAAAAATLAGHGMAVSFVRLDVTDAPSITAAVEEIDRRLGRLDVLINNAGISGGAAGTPSEVTLDQLCAVYETNVFGAVAVTNAALPLMRRSGAGCIVNVSSSLESLAQMTDPDYEFAGVNNLPYQSSKAALNAITIAYAKELAAANIKVNAADPGFTATDLNQRRGYRTVEQAATIIVRLAQCGADGPTATFQDESGTVPW